jgi:hypothetical protein
MASDVKTLKHCSDDLKAYVQEQIVIENAKRYVFGKTIHQKNLNTLDLDTLVVSLKKAKVNYSKKILDERIKTIDDNQKWQQSQYNKLFLNLNQARKDAHRIKVAFEESKVRAEKIVEEQKQLSLQIEIIKRDHRLSINKTLQLTDEKQQIIALTRIEMRTIPLNKEKLAQYARDAYGKIEEIKHESNKRLSFISELGKLDAQVVALEREHRDLLDKKRAQDVIEYESAANTLEARYEQDIAYIDDQFEKCTRKAINEMDFVKKQLADTAADYEKTIDEVRRNMSLTCSSAREDRNCIRASDKSEANICTAMERFGDYEFQAFLSYSLNRRLFIDFFWVHPILVSEYQHLSNNDRKSIPVILMIDKQAVHAGRLFFSPNIFTFTHYSARHTTTLEEIKVQMNELTAARDTLSKSEESMGKKILEDFKEFVSELKHLETTIDAKSCQMTDNLKELLATTDNPLPVADSQRLSKEIQMAQTDALRLNDDLGRKIGHFPDEFFPSLLALVNYLSTDMLIYSNYRPITDYIQSRGCYNCKTRHTCFPIIDT